MSNITQTLSEYVNKVLDTNKDGVVNMKDILGLFPSNAVAIAVIFIDVVVAAAEYRVWDVGLKMTGDPLKAIGFVLVSAVPFYLGQVFWLYPVANFFQKWIAGLMVGASLYTSWVFGTADLSQNFDVTAIISTVTNLTAGYIVVALAYVLLDDGIKAMRLKKQAEGKAKQEKEFQLITRAVLRELAETQKLQNETVKEFGDAEMVQKQLDRVAGRKGEKKQETPAYNPRLVYNSDTDTPKINTDGQGATKHDKGGDNADRPTNGQ